ncbi:MAG: HIT domain-containing protein [Lachnospiraceae bacterium]|nr:HIT domain-containing protein [Lachnospiraceae bacterium]
MINKRSEAYIVYEDSQLISFLDIEPIHAGHVLIVPKQHVGFRKVNRSIPKK